jgi:hypothetical protein
MLHGPSSYQLLEHGQDVCSQARDLFSHLLGRRLLGAERAKQLGQVDAGGGSRRVRVLDTEQGAHLVAAGNGEGADARQMHRAGKSQRKQSGTDDAADGLPASATTQRTPCCGEHGGSVEPHVGNRGCIAQAGDDVVRRVQAGLGAHHRSPSERISRNLASARALWDLTVPTEIPRIRRA